ncbi:MAG: ankyrin repeat domain-containing protein [Rhodoferax sp.]|nr:ankyrin repeat domain-containing protein [Rhodoferax sp.]
MTESQKPTQDTLLRLYEQASAEDPRRPAPQVADAIRKHARVMLAAGDASDAPAQSAGHVAQASANQPRWKTSLLASVAVIGLAAMLFLQFDRGTPQEQDLVRGQAAPNVRAPIPSQDQGTQAAMPSGTLAQAPGSGPASVASATIGRSTPAPPLGRAKSAEPQKSQPAVPAAGDATRSDAQGDTQRLAKAPVPGAPAAELREILPSPPPAPAPARAQARPAPALTLTEIARAGRVDALAAILASGAAINGRDADGRTPLMLAAIHGHREMVRQLLAAGADPRLRDPSDQTAAQLALAAGHMQIADLIGSGS